jgi:hypothetical protein
MVEIHFKPPVTGSRFAVSPPFEIIQKVCLKDVELLLLPEDRDLFFGTGNISAGRGRLPELLCIAGKKIPAGPAGTFLRKTHAAGVRRHDEIKTAGGAVFISWVCGLCRS